MQLDLNSAFSFAGYIAFIIGGLLYAKSKVPNQTIVNYKLLTESQDKRIKGLEDQAKLDRETQQNTSLEVARLQGQLITYKELPLKEIAVSLNSIDTTNQLILARLDKSADLLIDTIPSKVTTTTSTITK